MNAIVWTAYGPPDVLQLQEVETPVPKRNQVRIKIVATTVSTGDCEQRSLDLPLLFRLSMRAVVGLRRPARIRILGMELAGIVESAGQDVERFREGDEVFAATGLPGMGTNAEYICLPEEPEGGALAIKPANMTFEQAAAVPVGGLEALGFLRQGNIQSGQNVLTNGAGGTIGPFAVQLAKYFGAEVTAVDSTGKLDMLRSIGADRVMDYTQEDFTTSGETYDLILDVAGTSSFSGCASVLKENGRYLIANPDPSQRLRGRWTSLMGGLAGGKTGNRSLFGAASPKTEDLVFLKELVEAGALESVIDRRYPLEQAAEAHRYVESGHKTGNVVLTVAG